MVILVSGDGDFVPLVQFLRLNMGIRVEVASFGKSTSGKLREEADDFVDLCENPDKYLIRQRVPVQQKKVPNQKTTSMFGKSPERK